MQSLHVLVMLALLASGGIRVTRAADIHYIISSIAKFLVDGENLLGQEPDDIGRNLQDQYDFIIVGAGSAGSVLANRLTQVPHWRVLLIEAGGAENFVMDVPSLATRLQFTSANWNYKTEPQASGCLGHTNQRCPWPRGKVMGGSSVLHSMIHTRGHPNDYDGWQNLGNPGWGFASVLPYFKKHENMQVETMASDAKYHSTAGELNINYAKWNTPLSQAFLDAAVEVGDRLVDYNGGTMTGFSRIQFTLRNGTRLSASRAFLHPVRGRPNLHVLKWTTVSKVLVDPVTKVATGVEIQRGKRSATIRAVKEVIVSAGALNSPQLLMLSGIGPKAHLDNLGIHTIQDLRVGFNLQDHIALGGLIYTVDQPVSIRMDRILANFDSVWDYMKYHSGPLSAPSGTEAIAFIDTKHPNATDGYPDLELLFVAGSFVSDSIYRYAFGIDDAVFETVYQPIRNRDTWMVFPMLLLPESRGRIMLKDKHWTSKPLIYPNYLSTDHDMQVILKGVRKVQQLAQTRAMQRFGSKLHDIPLPQCRQHVFDSDEYWMCAMQTITQTIYHQSGTCKMGPNEDKTAVVDPRLRVHGINRLRVVDASIMPTVPAAHTNAPTLMVAEKAADMIKEDWAQRSPNEL